MAITKEIPVSKIRVERNDRTTFDPLRLQELAATIKENGLLNPITTRPDGNNASRFVLVAGERRLRAVQLLGWENIPAIVKDLTDEQAAEVMLSENVSRSDLDPIDEGAAYRLRIDKYGWTVVDCAKKAGVSINRVQYRLKLLALRTDLQDLVRSGNLELGYARMIAESGLDTNFQNTAFRALRDNSNPSPVWFRRVIGDLVNKAQTACLINDPLFSGVPLEAPKPVKIVLPPTPQSARPVGSSIPEHIAYWTRAAADWEHLGKNFKRDECLAAVSALNYVLQPIGG
jgi:ParB/RepB/Spo0J family partition protein